MKAILDGSVASTGDNLLVYATSNRRHLMPEKMQDNLASSMDEDGELHPAETIEEKMSLSERFGLWLSFYPFSQKNTWQSQKAGQSISAEKSPTDGKPKHCSLRFSGALVPAVWLTSLHGIGPEEHI